MRIGDWSSDVCSSDLVQASLPLPLLQRLQVAFPAQEIVHLHEIEALDAPERTLLLHLPRPARLQPGPDLLRREELRRAPELLQAIADDRRRGAVHRRAVEPPPAPIDEALPQLGPPVAHAPAPPPREGE